MNMLCSLEPSLYKDRNNVFRIPDKRVQEREELVLRTFRRCSIYRGDNKQFHNFCCSISTHEIYLYDTNILQVYSVQLERVISFKENNSFFHKSHKIDLTLRSRTRTKESHSIFADSSQLQILRIELHNRDSLDFANILQNALSKKLWRKTPAKLAARTDSFHSRAAGVGGIISRQARERDNTKELAEEAFEDLRVLMEKASLLVKLIERYSDELHKHKSENSTAEVMEFNNLLNDIGIVNPVTKQSAGSLYHEELALEISNFLSQNLDSHSKTGIITLTDLYCIANRARGAEVFSPNDLFQACSLFKTLRVPFTLRKLQSGTLVVQSNRNDEEHISKSIERLFLEEKIKCLTVSKVSEMLSISLPLAIEYLDIVESNGIICRDETMQEIWFYQNRFV